MSGADLLLLSGGAPQKATGDALLTVQANFCNLPTPEGKPMFTPFLISLDASQRQAWYQAQRQAGSTHLVYSPEISYPGAPWPATDLYDQPARFVDFIAEALQTPSADGLAFRPIIMLDPGWPDPEPRISKLWPPIIDELRRRDCLDYCLITPGWELITASDWTSANLSFGLELLHTLGVPHMWLHLSPGRASGSSNPIEPDDPWQGAESGFWYSHGGQYLEGLLYQSKNLVERDDPAVCDPVDDSCWLNRLEDVIPRLCNGLNGWRIVHLCLFETVAWGAWQGFNTPEYARDIATSGQVMAKKYQATMTNGNGLPW